MKRRLLNALTIAAIVVAGSAIATTSATPASASDRPGYICVLNQNTWLRAAPHSFVLRTLTAGRGFRVHGGQGENGDTWLWGHGAEAPEQDGWIPAGNVSSCYWP